MKINKNQQNGFTIVELLIVVVVIAILAAITIVSFNGIQDRAKSSAAQSVASQVAKKLSLYAVENSDTFPSAAQLEGMGIIDSQNSSFQYSYSSASPAVYCLTTTVSGKSFYTSNSSSSPTQGGCPGHSANGTQAIANMSVNPSFETSTDGVASYGTSTSRPTSGGDTGSAHTRSTRLGTTGTWGPWWDTVYSGIQPGESYTVSIRTRSNISASRNLQIEWKNASGSIISSASLNTATPGAGWTTMSGTATAVTGAAGIRLTLYASAPGATTDYVDIDSIMVTRGPDTRLYADGSTANWVWDGAVHNSASRGIPL